MKLSICGKAPGCEKALELPDSVIWCTASNKKLAPKADLIFELHDDISDALPYLDKNVVLMFNDLRFNNLKILPRSILLENFGPVFSSSISWMLAYSTLFPFSEINIFGVDMLHPSEYKNQRDSFFYLIGYLKSSGIRVNIDEKSGVYLNDIYGAKI